MLDSDPITQQHLDILKKIAQVWEIAPKWQLFQVINYLRNFSSTDKDYNLTDKELNGICDNIIIEADTFNKIIFFTKPLLIAKLKPRNRQQYLEAAKEILTSEDYDMVLDGIVWPDVYDQMNIDLKTVVDAFYQLSE